MTKKEPTYADTMVYTARKCFASLVAGGCNKQQALSTFYAIFSIQFLEHNYKFHKDSKLSLEQIEKNLDNYGIDDYALCGDLITLYISLKYGNKNLNIPYYNFPNFLKIHKIPNIFLIPVIHEITHMDWNKIKIRHLGMMYENTLDYMTEITGEHKC